MPEKGGYKTLDLIMEELKIGQPKARQAIKVLNIQPTAFNRDKRIKYYSPEDIQRLKEWLDKK
jgi:hypothetical protein